MDKRGDAIPIRLWLGLREEIEHWASSQGMPFSLAVNHLLDRGLYFSAYHFPHHKLKFTLDEDESQSNDCRELYKNPSKSR
jgi:hypothetical protein